MTQSDKPRILIFCDFYLPGYKSGGGMRTIVNMVERLGDRYDFRIVTRDHDGKTDKTPYTTVKINEWNQVGKASVYYISGDNINFKNIKRLVEETAPRTIYTNSFFATFTVFVLLLRKARRLRNIPIIIAPCGELLNGAMQLKRDKKKLFLMFARTLRLYDNIIWKIVEHEQEQLKKLKTKGGRTFVVPDMPPKHIFPEFRLENKPFKKAGELNMVYLSRLHPIKNLKFILEILPKIKEPVVFDVYGPVDHPEYVQECIEIIKTIPSNIKIEMKGEVTHENVLRTLEKYNFFIFPTRGENFGHIILEALAAGCPLIISDATPWIDLQKKGVGWDLPLDEKARWVEVLKYCINMNNEDYQRMALNSRQYLEKWLAESPIEKKTVNIFEFSLSVLSDHAV